MASAVNMEDVKRLVECSICLQRLEIPKQLNCNHHFCRTCVEGMMQFKGDGSVTINCPLGCSTQTTIGFDRTVNDLRASFELRGLLDIVKTENKELESQFPKCAYQEGCTEVVSIYCCEGMFCKQCYQVHKKTGVEDEHEGSRNLCFDQQVGILSVLCEKHGSVCTHLCADDALLCKYCVNRADDHKSHNKNTIPKDVQFIKQVLVRNVKKKENTRKFLDITNDEVLFNKREFHNLLKKRKEECLLQYTDYLNRQEELLKQEYSIICDNHLTQYGNISLQYYEEKLEKLDIELALQKKAILETIDANKNKLSLNTEIISLSETFNFLSEHPLGSLEVTAGKNVLVSNPPVPTLKTNVDRVKNNNNNNTVTAESRGLKSELQLSGKKRKIEIGTSPSHKQIQPFFDIQINNEPVCRLTFNMYEDITPITCRNFIGLCTHKKGYGYKGSKFAAVVPGKGCVGGDFIAGNGSAGKSFYSEKFKPENFIKKHNKYGLLSMVNTGGFHDSRFMITFGAVPSCDGQNVVFGDVTLESRRVLKRIGDVECHSSRPHKDIIIVNCGIL